MIGVALSLSIIEAVNHRAETRPAGKRGRNPEMNQSELIEKVAQATELNQAAAGHAVNEAHCEAQGGRREGSVA